MVEHRVLTGEELEWMRQVQPSSRPSSATAAILLARDGPRLSDLTTCTGIAARWCPVHGDCTCGDRDPDCPLHSTTSSHAEVNGE